MRADMSRLRPREAGTPSVVGARAGVQTAGGGYMRLPCRRRGSPAEKFVALFARLHPNTLTTNRRRLFRTHILCSFSFTPFRRPGPVGTLARHAPAAGGRRRVTPVGPPPGKFCPRVCSWAGLGSNYRNPTIRGSPLPLSSFLFPFEVSLPPASGPAGRSPCNGTTHWLCLDWPVRQRGPGRPGCARPTPGVREKRGLWKVAVSQEKKRDEKGEKSTNFVRPVGDFLCARGNRISRLATGVWRRASFSWRSLTWQPSSFPFLNRVFCRLLPWACLCSALDCWAPWTNSSSLVVCDWPDCSPVQPHSSQTLWSNLWPLTATPPTRPRRGSWRPRR